MASETVKKEKKGTNEPVKSDSSANMKSKPDTTPKSPKGAKMQNKILFITGADSGIGKACALLFANEGADVAIVYLNEDDDANDTKKKIEEYGRKCLLIRGDLRQEDFCKEAINKTIKEFGRIDVLINNAGTQIEADSLEDISTENMIKTFETNIFSMFWITKAALPHMKKGSAIVNTTSVTAYHGNPKLIDYSATKGAIVTFTRSLSDNLVSKGIRVNAVAPGPIWTPLITASEPGKTISQHGAGTPMQRAGQPSEVAPSYLFLACNEDSSYISGQVLHPNGGEVVNG
ncbi:MAG TPA: SDR family oxidoreductase [Hanamia sp.]|nr:SDR family oxidoreductase [Hanamia sp.]